MIKNNKGQIGTLPTAIIALVVAIIILVVGVVFVQELTDTDIVTKAESGSEVNQSITTVTALGEVLVNVPACQATLGIVINETGNVIPATNYSVTGCTIFSTGGVYNNSDWNVTYSFTQGGESFAAGNESVVGLGNFSDFIPLIVLALAASIIIGIILVAFAFRRQR